MKRQKQVQYPEYNLGERLKFLRETRKFTQEDLAKAAKLSQATVAHIERGTKDPSVKTLGALASALDVHIATLFSMDDVYVFDLKRLRRKYTRAELLTPHLYMAIGRVMEYARDIGFLK